MKEVIVYVTNYCPYCVQAKRLLTQLNLPFKEISLEGQDALRQRLSNENGGWRTVPMIFIGEQFIGGFDDMAKLHRDGKLIPMVQNG
jgi:glutaredoxin 3